MWIFDGNVLVNANWCTNIRLLKKKILFEDTKTILHEAKYNSEEEALEAFYAIRDAIKQDLTCTHIRVVIEE